MQMRLQNIFSGRMDVLEGSCQFSCGTEEEEVHRNIGEESQKKKKKPDFVSQDAAVDEMIDECDVNNDGADEILTQMRQDTSALVRICISHNEAFVKKCVG